MTLGIAWVRTLGRTDELVVASDSRLSGGQYWDSNPKIMLLPRSDCVMSFAGSTNDAYPLMLQAYNAISMYPRGANRVLDVMHLKGHLVRVLNYSRQFISNLPAGETEPTPPEVGFMFCGYSWREKRFRIWQLHYDGNIGQFTFRAVMPWRAQAGKLAREIGFVGDGPAVAKARSMLVDLLRAQGKLDNGGLNMEPFEVLRDIIRSAEFPSVGGPPQVVKIYQHMNALPFGVYWPTKNEGQVTVLGRPLMPYETTSWGVIDPDRPLDKPEMFDSGQTR